jgi:CheY-like chemotaxis protein
MDHENRESRGRVLLVEDDPMTRTIVERILSEEGYEVAAAAGGFEALFRLETGTLPDVILLDLMMGMMSGWEFRMRQWETPRIAGVPVVLMSAVEDIGRQAEQLEAAAYLEKPFHLAGLLETVSSVIDSGRRPETRLVSA